MKSVEALPRMDEELEVRQVFTLEGLRTRSEVSWGSYLGGLMVNHDKIVDDVDGKSPTHIEAKHVRLLSWAISVMITQVVLKTQVGRVVMFSHIMFGV